MKKSPSEESSAIAEFPEIQKIVLPTAPPLGGIAPCLREPRRGRLRLHGLKGAASQFHVMSRTVGIFFDDTEKEAMRLLMWRLSRFSGVEITTYCIMGNHFHLLLRIPQREKFLSRFEGGADSAGERRLLQHLRLLYSNAYLDKLQGEIGWLREQQREPEVQRLLDGFRNRLCDLSLFVKELKERYSRWYNKKHGRCGTLWMERFRSVLVEDGECLRTMAAYIDLNPVRANLVAKPEDYRWCGYCEALGGSKRMRRGLCRAIGWPLDHWAVGRGIRKRTGAEAYRCLLYETGMQRATGAACPSDSSEAGAGAAPPGIPPGEAHKVLERGGRLSPLDLLSSRVRWFSEGVALGSQGFVQQALEAAGCSFAGRQLGKPLPILTEGEIFTLSRRRKTGVG